MGDNYQHAVCVFWYFLKVFLFSHLTTLLIKLDFFPPLIDIAHIKCKKNYKYELRMNEL